MSYKYQPHSSNEIQDYERCLLGTFIGGADIPGDVTEKIFSSKKHETIFLKIKDLKDQGIVTDQKILTNELTLCGKLAAAGGAAYIGEMSLLTAGNIEFYKTKVIGAYRARLFSKALDDAKTALDNGETSETVSQMLHDTINDIEKTSGKPASLISYSRKSAADIMNTDYPDVSWVVVGVLPGGLTIINGGPKVGKSWFVLHLGTAVSSGGCFMGCCQTIKGEVLYLALEDTYRRIKSRLYKQQGTGNNNFFIETPGTWKGGVAGIKQYLKEYPETKLIIIDTLFKFNPINDTNSYSDTYSVLSEIQTIAQNTPIVLVHHTRKGAKNGNGSSWAEDGMGSQGINSACDTIIVINKPDGEASGTMTIKGRDIEERRLNIIFDKDICTWRITGEGNFEKQEPAAQAAVLELLEDAGPMGMKTGIIAEALKKNVSGVSNLLNSLLSKGKVHQPSYGYWSSVSHSHKLSQMKVSESVKVDNEVTFTDSLPLSNSESVKVDNDTETGWDKAIFRKAQGLPDFIDEAGSNATVDDIDIY